MQIKCHDGRACSQGKATINRLQNGKAPATDPVVAELLKADIKFSARKIHQLLKTKWKREKIPRSRKLGLIIKQA